MDEQRRSTPDPLTAVPKRRAWLGSTVALIGLGLLGAGAWYLTHRPAAPPDGAFAAGAARPASAGASGARGARGGTGGPPSMVGIATAKHADIPVVIDALGTVTSLENVTVQPQVAGVLTQVLYKEGQTVRKGDVLATIDPRSFQIALSQAQGARMRDAAQLDAARVTLQRYQTLLTQDSIARQDVDTQSALVKQLEGTVTIDRAAENTAALNLGYTRIVAPIDGRVGLRPVDAGNYVTTGTAGGVAAITRVTPIDVAFSIPQDRVPEVQARLAAGAQLPVAAFDRTRTRRLDDGLFLTLDNMVDTATGTVKAKARYPNAGGNLFPNQFVNVQLLLRTIAAAVVVPVTALRHGPDGDFVYVVKEGNTVELRLVTSGQSTVDQVAINTGLQAGETVVTEGGDRLKDGVKVQTAADRPAGAATEAASGGHGGRNGAGGRAAGHAAGASGPGAEPASGARRARAASTP